MNFGKPQRVLVTGATGFIGGRLCEVMALTNVFRPRALVHSTASAWRITRFPLDFITGDLCDSESVKHAIQGCDAVVHLAKGDTAVMRTGLENLLRASVDQGVSRFVHMSSVAVYGNHPPPESESESANPKRTNLPYGNQKLDQERRVLKYWKRRRLPVTILRPPNVYGPLAPFTLDLLNKIRTKSMAIVDAGKNPCNLVYIDNLIEATLLALWKPEAIGQIFFVTDDESISWGKCINDHAALIGETVPEVTTDQLIPVHQEHIIRDSFKMLPRILLSAELRSILRQIPAIGKVESAIYAKFQSFSEETRQRFRFAIRGPTLCHNNGSSACRFSAGDNIIAAQGRTVAHSNKKARRLLGYKSPVSYSKGMALTKKWLKHARII